MSAFSSLRSIIVGGLQHTPSFGRRVWAAYYGLRPKSVAYFHEPAVDRQKLFASIWKTNEWNSDESRSGGGSTLAYTSHIRKALPAVLERFNVRTLLDAPCGDFNWMQHVQLPQGTRYVGGDIVPEMIAELQEKYSNSVRRFCEVDIISGELPSADMWLSRDCFFHFPDEIVLELLYKFKNGTIPYLLTTTYNFSRDNPKINIGGFRFLNLRKPPFSLPKPLLEIDDFVVGYPPRVLALWSRNQLESWRPI